MPEPEVRIIPKDIWYHERAYVTGLELDASRYRWLRDNGHIKFMCYGQEVDDLVDAEMAKPPVKLEI